MSGNHIAKASRSCRDEIIERSRAISLGFEFEALRTVFKYSLPSGCEASKSLNPKAAAVMLHVRIARLLGS